jgi:hypothetical protein
MARLFGRIEKQRACFIAREEERRGIKAIHVFPHNDQHHPNFDPVFFFLPQFVGEILRHPQIRPPSYACKKYRAHST